MRIFLSAVLAFSVTVCGAAICYGGNDDALPTIAGVEVNPDGVLQARVLHPQLNRQWLEAARQHVPPDLARPSELRKVSLTRLERAVADKLQRGEALSDEMLHLAGLTRVQYVFFYPESGDIVFAGPAEAFAADGVGRVVGLDSGRPVIELQDVIVALRAYPPSGERTGSISVSIDPTPEGLERMQQFLRQIAGRVTPQDANRIAQGLRQSLGMQTITIQGVSPRTHFAQVLVEADYRMKLIGIGLEQPPVPITSYVARSNPRSVSRNALQRWYFTPNYECVRVSEDGLAMELVGDGVQLVGEDELVTAQGGRVASRNTNRASQLFVEEFTRKYPQLAAASPVYAQLRNMIDLAVAAAFIQEHDFYGGADWNLGVFQDEDALPVETYVEPRQVESAVNVVWRGNTLMTPIGGGVNIQPRQALVSSRLLADDGGRLGQLQHQLEPDLPDHDTWWWD